MEKNTDTDDSYLALMIPWPCHCFCYCFTMRQNALHYRGANTGSMSYFISAAPGEVLIHAELHPPNVESVCESLLAWRLVLL